MRKILSLLIALVFVCSVSAKLSVKPSFVETGTNQILVNYISPVSERGMSVVYYLPDLGIVEKSSINARKNKVVGTQFEVEILEPGLYPVRVAVHGDDTRKVKWTWLVVE